MISVVNFHTGANPTKSLSLLFPKWSPSMATLMIDDGNQASRWGREEEKTKKRRSPVEKLHPPPFRSFFFFFLLL